MRPRLPTERRRPATDIGRRTAANAIAASGFTLLELLVVVAIIAILAAMLLPTLGAAKMQAARIQCISNERQMLLAWTIYADDNDEHLALNGGATATLSITPHLWVYGGNHGSPDALTNDLYLTGANYALFSKLIPAEHVYKCPGDKSLWPLWDSMNTYVTELRSYAMNCYMGLSSNDDISPITLDAGYKVYTKTSQVVADSPASRFVFTDVNPASICTPAFGVDMTGLTWIHYPSDQHRQRGVLIFADGHAETHHWLDPRTMVHLAGGTEFIPHNVVAPNDQDLAWIVARTTSKN